MRDFHLKDRLTKACIESLLTFIPKVNNPQNMDEYRPICLVGCLYKILAKILASRLKKVIGKLISKKKTTFIPRRNILDGVLLVNEVLDLAIREIKICLVMKVDYEKAYGSVSWNYLRFLFNKMGFSAKWISLMEACVFGISMAVIVSENDTIDFNMEERVKTRRSIISVFFVVAMEGLTGLMNKSVELGEFRGFQNEDEFVDILQFADDTIIL